MRSTPRVLVLDGGAAHVSCARFTTDRSGRLCLHRFAIETHSADPAQDFLWGMHTLQALQTLAARERLHGLCRLAVPGHLALTRLVRSPAEPDKTTRLILEREAEKNIPHPIGGVVWDGQVLADTGKELELLLAAGKAEAMAGFCTAVTKAGFMPLWAEPGGIALWRAYCYNYQDAADDALVVDIGARTTCLLFAGLKRRFLLRSLAFGGNAVTLAVAAQLKLDFTDAEALKRQVLSGIAAAPTDPVAEKAVQQAGEQFAHRLELELMRSLLGQARRPEAIQPVRIFLTGGGAQLPGLVEYLAKKLQLPVQVYDALRHVQLTVRSTADGATQARQHLPILVGLAASHLPDLPRPLNLLPANLRAHQRFRRRQPWLIASAALLAIAWVPPLWHEREQIRATRMELARIEAELVPLRRLESRTTASSGRLKQMQQEIATLQRLLECKTVWPSFLADLQHRLAMAEDAWLERLQVAGAPGVRPEVPGNPAPPLRLEVSGRLLNRQAPLAKAGTESFRKVKALMDAIRTSPFVAGIEDERFDGSRPGVLRFDFTLVTGARHSL